MISIHLQLLGAAGQSDINHQALNYAHAAAIIRGCSFPVTAVLRPPQLQQLLPFVGAFTARIIHELASTGTSEQLEDFQADRPVTNSRGELRLGTEGGATRYAFARLPGVGATQAYTWYQLGYRSYEELQEAGKEGGPLAVGAGQYGMSREAWYCLRYREDLLEKVPGEDVEEMKGVVLELLDEISRKNGSSSEGGVGSGAESGLEKSQLLGTSASADGGGGTHRQDIGRSSMMEGGVVGSGSASGETAATPSSSGRYVSAAAAPVFSRSGWQIQLVGGGRRSRTSHDADFLITHPSYKLDGVVWELYNRLVAQGKLISQEEGFCRIQSGKMDGYLQTAKGDILNGRWVDRHQMDRYDHIYGIYLNSEGKKRRMDLILVPWSYWPYALVGWTGSKQYLRFMRQHAGNCGMFLNSHFLMRRVRVGPLEGTAVTDGTSGGGGVGGGGSGGGVGGGSGSGGSTTELTPAGAAQVAAVGGHAGAVLVLKVPEEVAPADSNGKDFWPPGWGPNVTAGAAGAGGRGTGTGGAAAGAGAGGAGPAGGAAAGAAGAIAVTETEGDAGDMVVVAPGMPQGGRLSAAESGQGRRSGAAGVALAGTETRKSQDGASAGGGAAGVVHEEGGVAGAGGGTAGGRLGHVAEVAVPASGLITAEGAGHEGMAWLGAEGKGRKVAVVTEADLFELLRIPWREAFERDC